jgi:cytoskeletal protein CcmA (bactofilin family)
VKVDHGKVLGPVAIHEDTRFHGMIDGGVKVDPGVTLDMRGMIAGDLVIEPDARVELRGMVAGSVTNKGYLTIYGVVRGPVRDEEGGETTYAPIGVGEEDRD